MLLSLLRILALLQASLIAAMLLIKNVALGGAGRAASKRLSDQRMVFDASLGLRGFSSAADGKIEPHFGEAQQPAFLDDRRGLPRTFDDLGGREPISFFVAHVLTSPIDMMV
jgi:hypothetical protein